MREYDVREAICEAGKRVWERGLVASNDGNISYRLDRDTVLATPTLMSKGFLDPDDLVLVDLEGNQKGGTQKSTSEIRMHLNVYRRRPDVRSVLHVHPPHVLAFALTGTPLPKCLMWEVEILLGEVPFVPYETPGTWDFARTLDPWLDYHDAFVLENHGAVTLGLDPFDAYYKMECVDQYCRVLLLAKDLGKEWKRLPPEKIEEVLAAKKAYGINDPRMSMAEFETDEVTPRRRTSDPGPFDCEPFDGVNYPKVTDAPKLSRVPSPEADE